MCYNIFISFGRTNKDFPLPIVESDLQKEIKELYERIKLYIERALLYEFAEASSASYASCRIVVKCEDFVTNFNVGVAKVPYEHTEIENKAIECAKKVIKEICFNVMMSEKFATH